MAIANRKTMQAAASMGGSADILQTMLDAGRPYQLIAGAMGVSLVHLNWALNLPTPVPLVPANWTKLNTGPCPYQGPWFGITPIAYAGPAEAGFTYGPPVSSRDGKTAANGGDFS